MKTFATLQGTDISDDRHKLIFERLSAIAKSAGFEAGNFRLPIRGNQIPLDDWHLEHFGPGDDSARFFLAVTAPKVPSMSPIPIQQTIRAPLFSVIVMPSFFGIWSENRPGDTFTETEDERDVEVEFSRFLDRLRESECRDAHNTNIHPPDDHSSADEDPQISGPVCQFCKKRPGHPEQRISAPMRLVEIIVCDECSKSVIY